MHGTESALSTIAVAAVAGMIAQIVGQRWRTPALVPLLVLGMVLGPSGFGLIQPATLGSGLSILVKLAVAVILFDGALNLRLSDLGRAIREVRNLVTIGALVTWIGATLAAWLIAGLSGRVAIVFGALLTVTGPTVVQPILRRVHLSRRLKTILEGEAILIDPVGAVLAVAVVDIILGIAGVRSIGVVGGIWGYAGRLIVGAIIGVAGGYGVSWLLKRPGWVPGELTNLVSLAGVWGVFGLAESVQGESGIMAAVAMGLAMQRGAIPEERRLRRFKEQLTVLGISLLFVLLSANLPLGVVRAEGARGFWTVAALMFLVRPASVWTALHSSGLSWRERAFISWIAPRGIVAASVASLFALELTEAGFAEGDRVLALTFLTIAITVTSQGLTAGFVARLLRLENLAGRKVIIVGAGPVALELASVLQRYDRPVAIVDRNAELVSVARSRGVEAVSGNALDESVLAAVGAEEAETLVAMTTNPEVNALAAQVAHDVFGIGRAYPVLANPTRGANPQLLDRVGGRAAFGRALDLRQWDYALEHGAASILVFRVPDGVSERRRVEALPDSMLPLGRVRQRSIEVTTAMQDWRGGDTIVVLTQLGEAESLDALIALTHREGHSATTA